MGERAGGAVMGGAVGPERQGAPAATPRDFAGAPRGAGAATGATAGQRDRAATGAEGGRWS